MKDPFTLLKKFEDASYRYVNVRNAVFRSVPEEEREDFLNGTLRVKACLDALKLHPRLPRALLERCRGRDWYERDREALSRHIALLVLIPDATDREKVPGAAGELTSSLLGERKALSGHYPHLYGPQALGAPAGIDREDVHNLRDEVRILEMEGAGLSEEEWDEMEMKRGIVEATMMALHEVDPLYLEESSAVWNEIGRACKVIVSENGGNVREGLAEMIRKNDPVARSVLTRFVLESLMLRLIVEDRAGDLDDLLDRYLGEDRARENVPRPLTREEADRSLDLIEPLFSEPLYAYVKMIDAARNMAALEDYGSAWNMAQAVLSRCPEEDYWPSMALKGVLFQLGSGEGRQVELARALLARGEERGDPVTTSEGLVAMTAALHSLGRDGEAAEYHRGMMRSLLAGRGDPDVLAVYPLAAAISISMGEKKSVRELAREGLREMEALPKLRGVRDQLLKLRRSMDRMDLDKDAAGKRGKGSRDRRRGR